MLDCVQKNNNPLAQGFLKILKKHRHPRNKKKWSVYHNGRQYNTPQYCCLWNKFQYLGLPNYLLLLVSI